MGEGNSVQVHGMEAPVYPAFKVEKVFSGAEPKLADAAATGAAEQRRHPRYTLDAWAEVMLKDATVLFRGRVLNISESGCFVATKARLRMTRGTPVEMAFRYRSRNLRCDAACMVVHPAGAGFLFGQMDAKTREAIDTLLAELQAVAEDSTLKFIGNLDSVDTQVGQRP